MTSLAAGKPAPLGASYDGKGVNFALFSAHAERVELCVFDEQGNEQRFDLPARSGDIWHGWLAAAGPGMNGLLAAIWAMRMEQCATIRGSAFLAANLLTGAFNLLPIPPLDGAQMLRCLLQSSPK